MLFWIEGQFWSWKTNLWVNYAFSLTQRMWIFAKKLLWWKVYVYTNIKLNEYLFKDNYFYFDDDNFYETLKTISAINDYERSLYFEMKSFSNLKQRLRNKFSQFIVLFDESWAIENSSNYKDFKKKCLEYINQNRKLFSHVYLISVDWSENQKSMRDKVDLWLTVKPIPFLQYFPFFKNIWLVYWYRKDSEGNILQKSYNYRDSNWNLLTKKKDDIFWLDWFYKPTVWKMYDDLHKNIRDIDKYKDLNDKVIDKIIWLDKFNSFINKG